MTEITTENFEAEVLHFSGDLLLDFRAKWCIPCRKVTKALEKIAIERPDIKICTVDIDEQPEITAKLGIMSIPTLIAYRGGKPIDQFSGILSRRTILSMFK